ncbi:unnamed protein product [Brassicogethes aeneus]|uniref:Lipase domain-containing protein n=1 Tax=Brassicogethes aeneus TaxID=1431903 RepID=A0A9P0FEL8_BRAAE|nr:unnamed protein product [Brassicogethes aeneus]
MRWLTCLTFAVLATISVNGQLGESLKKDFFDVYKNTAKVARNVTSEPVSADKVTYYLFKKDNPTKFIQVDAKKLDDQWNKDAKIVFFIHGWTNSRDIQWYEDLKNSFLNRKEEYYVVQVDWNEPANAIYTVASISTYDVGNHIGDLIVDLHKNHGIPLEHFVLVGHSLGGQISGFIGKRVFKETGKKLPRIIALDPAGPLFIQRPEDKRLNPSDAEVVEVLHSDGYTLGYPTSIGTIDFYPNGGNSQPGCKRIDLLDFRSLGDPFFCDHRRAWAYYTEAILNPGTMLAKKCKDWKSFKDNKCDNVTVAVGDITTMEKGDFFLETNKEPPYTKNGNTKKGLGGQILSLLPKF